MRWRTPKRARLDRLVEVERVKFRQEFKKCWHCGSTWNLCIDEIASGTAGRIHGYQDRRAWTLLCGKCNTDDLNGSSLPVLLTKMALKLLNDRKYFGVVAVNRMRGRADNAITLAEVICFWCRRQDG